MKYVDEQDAKLGDKVMLWDGCFGVIVCSIDTCEYTPNFPKDEWAYLSSGVIIKTEKSGLIHYIKADEDLKLVCRSASP